MDANKFSAALRRTTSAYQIRETGRRDAQATKFGVDRIGLPIKRALYNFIGDSIFVDSSSRGEFWIVLNDEGGHPTNAIYATPGMKIKNCPYSKVAVLFRDVGDVTARIALCNDVDFSFGDVAQSAEFATTAKSLSCVATGVGTATNSELVTPENVVPVYSRIIVMTSGAVTGAACISFGYNEIGSPPPAVSDMTRIISQGIVNDASSFILDCANTAPGPDESAFIHVQPLNTFTANIECAITYRPEVKFA